jgi:broad specificity phosphatase PhoE
VDPGSLLEVAQSHFAARNLLFSPRARPLERASPKPEISRSCLICDCAFVGEPSSVPTFSTNPFDHFRSQLRLVWERASWPNQLVRQLGSAALREDTLEPDTAMSHGVERVLAYIDRGLRVRAATTFILVRHGQSTGNLSNGTLMGGWTDLPLTEFGWTQASTLAARLLDEQRPNIIYSSSLQRAVQTALVLAERLSVRPPVIEPALREIGCGVVDGWPVHRVQECYPEEWASNSKQTDPDFRWPGGESYREFRQRILRAIDAMAWRHPAQRVLVVTHAGVISQLVGWIRGDNPARWELFRPRNTSVTELRWRGTNGEVVRFDEFEGTSARASER